MSSRRGTYQGAMPTEIWSVAYPIGPTGKYTHRLYEKPWIVRALVSRWRTARNRGDDTPQPLIFKAVITGWESVEPDNIN